MKKKCKITLFVSFVCLSMTVLVYIWYAFCYVPTGEGIWSSTSPEGEFEVVGYAKFSLRKLLPTVPGSGGDADGIIVLREKKSSKIIQKINVDLINFHNKNDVTWTTRGKNSSAQVIIIGDDIIWDLPQP
jgi:hypothetical protein